MEDAALIAVVDAANGEVDAPGAVGSVGIGRGRPKPTRWRIGEDPEGSGHPGRRCQPGPGARARRPPPGPDRHRHRRGPPWPGAQAASLWQIRLSRLHRAGARQPPQRPMVGGGIHPAGVVHSGKAQAGAASISSTGPIAPFPARAKSLRMSLCPEHPRQTPAQPGRFILRSRGALVILEV